MKKADLLRRLDAGGVAPLILPPDECPFAFNGEHAVTIGTFDFSIVDSFSAQVAELAHIEANLDQSAVAYNWILYPRTRTLVKLLNKADFLKVRSSRNRYLIDDKQQERLFAFKVGVAGLSVGNSLAVSLIVHGGGGYVKLADADVYALSNMNRVRMGIGDLGEMKVDVAAQEMYEINPYINVDVYAQRLDVSNVNLFLDDPQLDVCVDEVDDLGAKVLLRMEARKRGIPVVMVTDSEDSVIIDVERYDLDSAYPIFHGILSKEEVQEISNGLDSVADFIRIGKKLIGEENITKKMTRSLNMIPNELRSVPQLATASLAAGPIGVKVIRDIALGVNEKSFRRIIEL